MLLIDLPQEVVGAVLRACADPLDLIRVAQTCRDLNAEVDDEILWRTHFLRTFDRPYETPVSWQETMKDRLRAKVAMSSAVALQAGADSVRATLLDIAASSAMSSEHVVSLNSAFFTDCLGRDIGQTLLTVPLKQAPTRSSAPIQDRAARVRLLEGLCRLPNYRGEAKARVYDLQHYNQENQFSPLHSDGTVDWLGLEAVAHVMRTNLEEVYPDWDEVDVEGEPCKPPPIGYAVMLPWPARPLADLHSGDWAGVERWPLVGSYAFLDFRDFHQFQLSYAIGMRRSLENVGEGAGDMMQLRLHLVDGPPTRASDSRSIPTSGRRRTLYFRGTSSNLAVLGDSGVSGSVLETPDGQIRWRFIISCLSLLTSNGTEELTIHADAGADRWALEGVQLGSSGMIAGVWSDASRDDMGPVGPWMYWRGYPYPQES